MGQYVTPRGVVLTMDDVAARAVGYAPAEQPKKPARKAPAKKAEKSADEK